MIVREFARYFVAGCAAVGIHLTVLVALTEGLHLRPTVATGIGFVLGSIVNYLLQRSWVFRAAGAHRVFFARYALITSGTFLLNLALFWLLHEALHLWYLGAQILVTGFIFLVNFALNRGYTFRVRREPAG